ncbi:hypothetical protein L915_07153 [Phytophthora nicotianae]|uniref:Uncharacterized protein n=1 Tax=Phytophthora nicotianae TaxID=4792 RepID=W2H0F5_PHYNI|nr:hypothetical protein L915_07153 [Phytophthora nicotianae]
MYFSTYFNTGLMTARPTVYAGDGSSPDYRVSTLSCVGPYDLAGMKGPSA